MSKTDQKKITNQPKKLAKKTIKKKQMITKRRKIKKIKGES